MSDQPQGPGWWLGQDGKFYPPEARPAGPQPLPQSAFHPPPQYPPPGYYPQPQPVIVKQNGCLTALGVLFGVFVILVVVVIAITALGASSSKKSTITPGTPVTTLAPVAIS